VLLSFSLKLAAVRPKIHALSFIENASSVTIYYPLVFYLALTQTWKNIEIFYQDEKNDQYFNIKKWIEQLLYSYSIYHFLICIIYWYYCSIPCSYLWAYPWLLTTSIGITFLIACYRFFGIACCQLIASLISHETVLPYLGF
jgi:hypothetical protein